MNIQVEFLQNLKFFIGLTITVAKGLYTNSKEIIQFTEISITFSQVTKTTSLFCPTPAIYLPATPAGFFLQLCST